MATPTSPGAVAMLHREMRKLIATMETDIMSPPRRPRGEKPAITIRFLNHTVSELQKVVDAYRRRIEEQAKQIARQDVELSEAADNERLARCRIDDLQHSAKGADQMLAGLSERVSFLEGYYAKSIEAITQCQANRGASAGDSSLLQNGAQTAQGSGPDLSADRNVATPGRQIRGIRSNDPAYTNWRSVEERPIAEAVHDGISPDGGRYRR